MSNLMFFLRARSKNAPVTLHVRGTINEKGDLGFVHGECILLVKQTSPNHMEVIKQVGVVCIENNKISFHYTDENFKESINYDEETGYSTMDGSPWGVFRTTYQDKNGMNENKLAPTTGNHTYMYSSAKAPFNNFGPLLNLMRNQSFFNKPKGNDSDDKLSPAPSNDRF